MPEVEKSPPLPTRPCLIALAGPSGSGKSSMARALAARLPKGQAVVISADRYYHDLSHLTPDERERVNFDDPNAMDHAALARNLQALHSGWAIRTPDYDFATHTRTKRRPRVASAPYVIVEGLFLLAWDDCRPLFDLKVFVEAPDDVCLARRLRRDRVDRNRSSDEIRRQYETTVRPMCERHIRPSASHADLVVDAAGAPLDAVERILERLIDPSEAMNDPDSARAARLSLIEELERQYTGSLGRRWRCARKKYTWLAVVGGARVIKRTVDLVASGAALVAFSPVFGALALAVKLTDGGPIFYTATRVGKWGREFPFPKFRSMVLNADKIKDELLEENEHGADGVTFKMKNDPRITWIGRFMRRTSLDELPQLWSVFNGDMSLVGPRPPVPREVAEYSLSDRHRLDVTPGITCIWQVSGRSDIPFPEQVELDAQYIHSQSLWTDLRLLLQTVPAVLLGKGAY